MDPNSAEEPAEAARAFAQGEAPLALPDDLPPEARALVESVARSCGERIVDLERREARAQANLVDLRMMLEGYTRVKRELRAENEQLRTAQDPARQPLI